MPGIRIAGPSDEPALFELGKFIHATETVPQTSLNPDKLMDAIQAATRAKGGIIAIIDGPDGIEASGFLIFDQFYWSDDFYLLERWLYVHPDHRSPEKAHWEALVDWVQEVKAKLESGGTKLPALIGVMGRNRVEAKVKMYGTRFQMIGATFLLP